MKMLLNVDWSWINSKKLIKARRPTGASARWSDGRTCPQVYVAIMEFDPFGLEEDEDADTQFMIEQSLLEISRLSESFRESADSRLEHLSFTVCPSETEQTENWRPSSSSSILQHWAHFKKQTEDFLSYKRRWVRLQHWRVSVFSDEDPEEIKASVQTFISMKGGFTDVWRSGVKRKVWSSSQIFMWGRFSVVISWLPPDFWG